MGYWYEGKWFAQETVELSVTDPSFLFGTSVFTTLRAFDGNLEDPRCHWKAHGDRLRLTIQGLQWAEPDWDRIQTGAQRVAQDYPVVRIAILHDGREFIVGRQLPAHLAEKQRSGIKAWLATDSLYQRPLATFKTGNYLSPWLALQRAIAAGAGEAILLATTGEWLETATGNLWGYADGQWFTPPLENILPGVMRDHLMAQLARQGQTVREDPWTPDLIQTFTAIAYSNSVVGVIPFTEILNLSPSAPDPRGQTVAIRTLQHLSDRRDFEQP